MPNAKIQLFLRPVAVVHLQLLFHSHYVCHRHRHRHARWASDVDGATTLAIGTGPSWAMPIVFLRSSTTPCRWFLSVGGSGLVFNVVGSKVQVSLFQNNCFFFFQKMIKVIESSSLSSGGNHSRDLVGSSCSCCLLYRLSLAKVYIFIQYH